MNNNIADLRKEYSQAELLESAINPDPIPQFALWFQQALESNLQEPNAMTIATIGQDGLPNARIVLLKDFDARGFVFFTNYRSQKGQELAANPQAAIVFLWAELERQVRIQGTVEKVSPTESDYYFHTRPLGSQLGAWASEQSDVIISRDILETKLKAIETQYENQDIPRPDHWGGYRVLPSTIEFWQGRKNRLHDRLRYKRLDNQQWLIERLCP
jgi:pyridoxamine 5'-phosphate oxidase